MCLLTLDNHYCEVFAQAMGTFFSLIIGKCHDGRYLFVSSHNFGCLLRAHDEKYNRSELRKHLNAQETETLIALLAEFENL